MDRLISSAASTGVYQILKLTVLSSLLAAVTLPVTVMSAASLLDNPWERVATFASYYVSSIITTKNSQFVADEHAKLAKNLRISSIDEFMESDQ